MATKEKLINGQLRRITVRGTRVTQRYYDGRWMAEADWLKPKDEVSNPAHYTDGKIEVIDFIEDKNLGFHLGNAVKYIARAGKKDPTKEVQDLEKAAWYLARRIANLKKSV